PCDCMQWHCKTPRMNGQHSIREFAGCRGLDRAAARIASNRKAAFRPGAHTLRDQRKDLICDLAEICRTPAHRHGRAESVASWALLPEGGGYAVQRLFRASELAWQNAEADLCGSARASRKCRSPRLFDVLDHRAFLFSKIRRLAQSVRVLCEML